MSAKLSDLAAFCTVATHLSFQKAASARSVTRSAISHSVGSLERALGVRLLNRDTRRVSLTDAGQALFERTGQAFDLIAEALRHVEHLRDAPMGCLRICALRSVAAPVLSPVIAKLTRQNPGLSIDVVLDDGDGHLVADGFDAALRFLDQLPDDAIAVKLRRRFASAVVAAPTYLEGAEPIVTPEDLRRHSCVRRHVDGAEAPWSFARDGERLRVAVKGPIALDSEAMMIEAALAGVGPAYVSEESVRAHLASGRLVRLLADWTPAADLYLCYPSRRQPPASVRALVSALKEAA